MSQPRDRRTVAFLTLCVVCVGAIVIYGWWTLRSRRSPAETPQVPPVEATAPSTASPAPTASTENPAPAAQAKPFSASPPKSATGPTKPPTRPPNQEAQPALLYFRANALGANYGKVAVAPLDNLDQRRYAADLYCDRVDFSNGDGVCLHADRGSLTTHFAIGFNDQMQQVWSFKLNGLPSRVRLSPSGRLAAITIFLSGQSYTSLNFATQTMIVKAATGEVVVDNLETFSVTRNGAEFKSKDFNFWGVTFAKDENRFYATLWTAGNTYLVLADLAQRAAQVVHDNVECPALSPDNTRVAFKQRRVGGLLEGGRITWHLTVLDLKSGIETPLGENRSVDDQVEWLDNDHILYALSESEKGSSASTDVWKLPTTANGTPELLLKGGFSPAVVRPNAR